MRRARDALLEKDLRLQPVTKICSYCDEHKKLFAPRRTLSSCVLQRREPESYDRQQSRSSAACRGDERRQSTSGFTRHTAATFYKSSGQPRSALRSPTAPCLKRIGKKAESGKKVNFHEEKKSRTPAAVDSSSNERKPSYESCLTSNSSSYNEPAGFAFFKSKRAPPSQSSSGCSCPASEALSSSGNSSFESRYRAYMSKLKCCSELRNFDEPFRRTIKHRGLGDNEVALRRRETSQFMEPSWSHGIQDEGASPSEELISLKNLPSPPRRRRSCSSRRDLAEQLEQLSLSSTTTGTCCSPPRPRIVKPKDALRRPALKKMLVYPPQGQSGEALTLYKKSSNIDCHVRGDPKRGFRWRSQKCSYLPKDRWVLSHPKYKVYYVQKFESDKWFPNEKTGSPFQRLEDADCTTDYG